MSEGKVVGYIVGTVPKEGQRINGTVDWAKTATEAMHRIYQGLGKVPEGWVIAEVLEVPGTVERVAHIRDDWKTVRTDLGEYQGGHEFIPPGDTLMEPWHVDFYLRHTPTEYRIGKVV